MESQQLHDLIQRVTLETLIQYGLLPDPRHDGMFQHPPSNLEYLAMLSGGSYLDAKPEKHMIHLSTLEMDTTEHSSLIWELGNLMEAVDIHISNLMKFREQLQSRYGNLVDGIRGLGVVKLLDSDR